MDGCAHTQGGRGRTTHWLGAGMLAAAEEAPPRSSAMRWRALAPALGLIEGGARGTGLAVNGRCVDGSTAMHGIQQQPGP